eukprot:10635612-Lingulodinium_polyedra.AAC.1
MLTAGSPQFLRLLDDLAANRAGWTGLLTNDLAWVATWAPRECAELPSPEANIKAWLDVAVAAPK